MRHEIHRCGMTYVTYVTLFYATGETIRYTIDTDCTRYVTGYGEPGTHCIETEYDCGQACDGTEFDSVAEAIADTIASHH